MIDILRIPCSQVIEELSGHIGQFPRRVIKCGGDDDFTGRDVLEEDLERRTVFGISVEMSDAIDAASGVVEDDQVETATSVVQTFRHHQTTLWIVV